MNNLTPYEPETLDYQFPTSLPATPSNVTHSDWERIESDFEQSPAFWKRKAVLAFVVAPLAMCAVAKFAMVGVTVVELATCGGVAFVAWLLRPATPSGTAQRYADTQDTWPATVSSATPSKEVKIVIVNNVTINQ